MRKFGLLGGTSWHSTVDYYRGLNELANRHFQGNVNPPLYVANLNQAEIHGLQVQGDWDAIAEMFIKKCKELELIGCEGLAFCANTPHRIYDLVQGNLGIPILHIGDAIGVAAQSLSVNKVALLGTRYTMEGRFIKKILEEKYALEIVTPDEKDRRKIQDHVYQEMSQGQFRSDTRDYFCFILNALQKRGAEAVILGCTEFPILLNGTDVGMPKIDSSKNHVEAILDFILSNDMTLPVGETAM